jgi:LysR family transcriptional regulator for metE and metH
MILQLVASGRGVSALPNWALTEYLDKKYVVARQLGDAGQWGTLFAAIRSDDESMAFMQAFLKIAKETAFKVLKDIEPLHFHTS